MSELQDAIDQSQEDLKSRDEQVEEEIAATYADIHRALEVKLENAISDEDELSIWRTEQLLQEVEEEFTKYSDTTLKHTIETHSQGAYLEGAESGFRLIQAQLWDDAVTTGLFTRLPYQHIESMFGMTRSGPLQRLLASFGPEIAAGMRLELVNGIAMGTPPRTIARNMTRHFGIGANRADNIARTEMLRAYRSSHKRLYQENADILEGWVWHSALDDRSCVLCVAQHGSVHPLDEEMPTHNRCRCSMIPLTKSWSDLGFTGIQETRYETELGSAWFSKQPYEKQRKTLGPKAHDAYLAGELNITDLVGIKSNRTWGDSVYRKPLSQVLVTP